MKRGFTLVELLGVIVILAIISVLMFPVITNNLKSAQKKIDNSTEQIVFSAADEYIKEKQNNYPLTANATYCITIQNLIDNGNLSEDSLKESSKKGTIVPTGTVRATVNGNIYDYKYNASACS